MANAGWNINRPAALGLEWLASRQIGEQVAFGAPVFFQQLRSTSAQTVTALRMHMRNPQPSFAQLFTVCDVIPSGSEVVPKATAILRPNADVSIGSWRNTLNGNTNLWAGIDDDVQLPPVGTDWVQHALGGASAYTFHVDTSGVPAGARIHRLVINAVDSSVALAAINFRDIVYRIQWIPTGDLYTPPNANFDADIYGDARLLDLGEINPRTNAPWTRQDLTDFDVGGNWACRIEGVGDSTTAIRVSSYALICTYSPTENRVAVGSALVPAGTPGAWITTSSLINPLTGAANWSKPASGDFLFGWRPALAPMVTQNAPIRTDVRWDSAIAQISGYELPGDGKFYAPVAGMRGDKIPCDDVGGLPTRAFNGGYRQIATLGLIVAGAAADDSQPYYLDGTNYLFATGSTVVAQTFTPTASASYLALRFLTGPPSGTGSLTVTVNRVSDGVQMGGSFTITAADVRALPVVASGAVERYVEGILSTAAALVNGTQYELRFTPTGSGSWSFPGAGASSSQSMEAASFEGASGRARQGAATSGAPGAVDRDLPAQLLVQPVAPPTFEAEVVEHPVVPSRSRCSVGGVEHVTLKWGQPSPSLAAGFAYYEIQRLDDDDTATWRTIARVLAELRLAWTDREARRGWHVQYRIRAVATTGAFSTWAYSQWVMPRATDAEIIFTSNADPSIEVVLDHEPVVGLDPLDFAADSVMRVYGADYQLAFMAGEQRGWVIDTNLIVNMLDDSVDRIGRPTSGEEVFEPLRSAVRKSLPYVCVLTHDGRRSFAHVVLGKATYEQPGNRYAAPVTWLPLTIDPYAVDA